jgi:hypothetical protein
LTTTGVATAEIRVMATSMAVRVMRNSPWPGSAPASWEQT